ncbi:hypothetical protein Rsub_04390 [Raphidocelis subcapitata]|uniref:Uncharacterized protein n=1 Tax=Raphidocelis subcapitata TaxID=307507 RepID=A0A2V0P2H4_9CHLO|nr:hypothetical protein Rsub_04390 [Raphidocelis subcapitata]|eukprot:GBF92043.1 hypothetical protein Rsub_04390 [Raphidocelis subcapitata]
MKRAEAAPGALLHPARTEAEAVERRKARRTGPAVPCSVRRAAAAAGDASHPPAPCLAAHRALAAGAAAELPAGAWGGLGGAVFDGAAAAPLSPSARAASWPQLAPPARALTPLQQLQQQQQQQQQEAHAPHPHQQPPDPPRQPSPDDAPRPAAPDQRRPASAGASPCAPAKAVRFAPGPLPPSARDVGVDGHPAGEGRVAVPVRLLRHAPPQDLTRSNVLALEELLGPENAPSLGRLKRRVGMLPPGRPPRVHLTAARVQQRQAA